ncbi:MAG: flippase [Ardenticatenaceae bacterium]|nr:flippase [Ardenticatenaceae bacterium]MCB9442669.1 flippase [Ardenticatenaceae bacterium]
MNVTGKTIAKNASFLMLSQLVTWGLSLIIMIVLPRYLGPEVTGKYYTAVSVWNIMSMVITFGMDMLLAKEIAKDPARISDFYGNSFFLRTSLFILGGLVVAAYAALVHYPSETIVMLVIIGLGTLVWQYASICQASLQGLEKMQYISLANISSKFFSTIVTLILVFMGMGIYLIASVYIGMALVSFLIQNHYVRILHKPQFRINLKQAVGMLKSGFPYLLSGAAITLYLEVDIIIISMLANERTVGWYGSADVLYGTLLFVPTVLMTAVFPALSRENVKDREILKKLVQKSFNLLLLVGVPIGFGIFLIADSLVVLLYGPEFLGSGPVLAIKGLVLTMTYQNMIIGTALISMDKQNPWTLVMTIGTIAVVPLDLILVPWTHNSFGNGAIGASIVFIFTELFMMIAGIRLLPAQTLNKSNLVYSIKVFAAGIIMIAVTWWFRDAFIAIPIIIGAVTYGISALLLRLLSEEDWEILKGVRNTVVTKIQSRRMNPA